MMYRLIYASCAAERLTNDDLSDILETSRRFNQKADITGVLLFHNGRFMQVLEGEQIKVKALMKRIGLDSRHVRVDVIFEEQATHSMFADWNMAYVPGGPELDKRLEGVGGFETLSKFGDDVAPAAGIISSFLAAVLGEMAASAAVHH